ncbi:MAG: hypothetical protein ACI9TH_004281 [Kiritimatiellia bacterium]|jgi:hypothetical protein
MRRLFLFLSLLTLSACVTMHLKPLEDWETMTKAVADAPALAFGQSWEKAPAEADGSQVQVIREADALLIVARLHDPDIFNTNTTFNAPFFMNGDVFEIFLHPEGQEAYFELHIGPQNQQFQLKIDSAETFAAKRKTWPAVEELIGPYKITDQHFRSGTRVNDNGTWDVAARIPYAFLSDGENKVDDQTVFHANFSRYDYTQGVKEPVYWATAPLSKLDFHHQPDWHRLDSQ